MAGQEIWGGSSPSPLLDSAHQHIVGQPGGVEFSPPREAGPGEDLEMRMARMSPEIDDGSVRVREWETDARMGGADPPVQQSISPGGSSATLVVGGGGQPSGARAGPTGRPPGSSPLASQAVLGSSPIFAEAKSHQAPPQGSEFDSAGRGGSSAARGSPASAGASPPTSPGGSSHVLTVPDATLPPLSDADGSRSGFEGSYAHGAQHAANARGAPIGASSSAYASARAGDVPVTSGGAVLSGVGAPVASSSTHEVRLSEMQFAISFDDAAQDIAQHIRKIRATYDPPNATGPEDAEVAEFEVRPDNGEVRTVSPGRTLQRSPSQTVVGLVDSSDHVGERFGGAATTRPTGPAAIAAAHEERLATFEERLRQIEELDARLREREEAEKRRWYEKQIREHHGEIVGGGAPKGVDGGDHVEDESTGVTVDGNRIQVQRGRGGGGQSREDPINININLTGQQVLNGNASGGGTIDSRMAEGNRGLSPPGSAGPSHSAEADLQRFQRSGTGQSSVERVVPGGNAPLYDPSSASAARSSPSGNSTAGGNSVPPPVERPFYDNAKMNAVFEGQYRGTDPFAVDDWRLREIEQNYAATDLQVGDARLEDQRFRTYSAAVRNYQSSGAAYSPGADVTGAIPGFFEASDHPLLNREDGTERMMRSQYMARSPISKQLHYGGGQGSSTFADAYGGLGQRAGENTTLVGPLGPTVASVPGGVPGLVPGLDASAGMMSASAPGVTGSAFVGRDPGRFGPISPARMEMGASHSQLLSRFEQDFRQVKFEFANQRGLAHEDGVARPRDHTRDLRKALALGASVEGDLLLAQKMAADNGIFPREEGG